MVMVQQRRHLKRQSRTITCLWCYWSIYNTFGNEARVAEAIMTHMYLAHGCG